NSLAVAPRTMIMTLAGWVTRWACAPGASDRFPPAMVLVVGNVSIATAVAVTVLGRTELAVFATAYLLQPGADPCRGPGSGPASPNSGHGAPRWRERIMSQRTLVGGDGNAGLNQEGRGAGRPSEDRSCPLRLPDEHLRFETLLVELSAHFVSV